GRGPDRRRRADPRARERRPGRVSHRVPSALALLPAGRARGRARRRAPSRPAPDLVVRGRELPRQLSADQLADVVEGRPAPVEPPATVDEPLEHARAIAAGLSPAEQREVLDAHPRIGARSGLSQRSASEQGTDDDPDVLAALAELNRAYEERFGFR